MGNAVIQSTVTLTIAFVLLWNSGFIGAELGLPYAGPFTLLFWRYLALALILLFYLKLRGRLLWPGWDRVWPTSIVGILAHGVWLSCVLVALEAGVPAGIVALVIALQPLATGCLSGLVTGEATSARQWLGLLTGFSGVALPIIARIDGGDAATTFGLLIPFGSVLALTAANLIERRLELQGDYSPLANDQSIFYQSVVTFLLLVVPALMLEGLSTDWDPVFIGTMAWLVFGVSLSAYALMWRLLARMDATRVASLFYLGPPVTMLMAWIAFGDVVAPLDLVGLAIVAAGVLLTHSGGRGRKQHA
ncbi:MAG: DMT family transporter [Wenzhouxiangellaceae bacterium]|nr:DMT family transporter [Wenzhouxiangellaceae bacterium]